MTFATTAEAGGGAALTMQREANHWVNNEAALVECDPALIPTMGTRAFDVSGAAIQLRNGSEASVSSLTPECLAMLPAEGQHSTAMMRPRTDHILSRAPCAASGGGGWSLDASTGTIKGGANMCAVYSKTNWSIAVFPKDCGEASADPVLGTKWAHDSATGHLEATEWSPMPGSAVKNVPQAVPHCLLVPRPNINISLGMAVLLRESAGGASAKNVPALSTTTGNTPWASFGSFKIEAEKEYILSVSIETTRTNDVAPEASALNTALAQVRATDVDAVAAANRAWWLRWWETGATVDLGPQRQSLERYWYGQQYMLGSMSRPCNRSALGQARSGRCRDGPTVPGLLGPWSMMNPVGWCDRLTLDYNVEANYWGAASSNHLEAMEPYFPTMDSMLESGKRRANMSWASPWGKYKGYENASAYPQAHPAYARWMTDLEHVNYGTLEALAHLPKGFGHFEGAEMACAMGPWVRPPLIDVCAVMPVMITSLLRLLNFLILTGTSTNSLRPTWANGRIMPCASMAR